MLVVDIMHNLFLGTGKHVIKDIWIELQLISESQFEVIQSRMDRMVIPSPEMPYGAADIHMFALYKPLLTNYKLTRSYEYDNFLNNKQK